MKPPDSPLTPHPSMFTAEVSGHGIAETTINNDRLDYAACLVSVSSDNAPVPGTNVTPEERSIKPAPLVKEKEIRMKRYLEQIVLSIIDNNDRRHKLPITMGDDSFLEFLSSKASSEQIEALLLSLYFAWEYETGDEDSLRRFLPKKAWEAYSAGSKLMFTKTRNNQFRCWYGTPASIGREYVDSCGNNLLFSISAEADGAHDGGRSRYFVRDIMHKLSLDEPDCEKYGVKIWNPVHLPSEQA